MEKPTIDTLITINVDVQNDFCPGGALAVTGGDEVVDPLNDLNTLTRATDGLVIFTGDQHPEETDHFNKWPVHCVAGTEGAALRDDLRVEPDDIIIAKGTGQTDGYSAFEGATATGETLTEIIEREARGKRLALLLGGLATDYCVKNSALDAITVAQRLNETGDDVTVYVLRDAIRAVNLQPNDGEHAIAEMEQAGAIIVDTLDIVEQRVLTLAK